MAKSAKTYFFYNHHVGIIGHDWTSVGTFLPGRNATLRRLYSWILAAKQRNQWLDSRTQGQILRSKRMEKETGIE